MSKPEQGFASLVPQTEGKGQRIESTCPRAQIQSCCQEWELNPDLPRITLQKDTHALWASGIYICWSSNTMWLCLHRAEPRWIGCASWLGSEAQACWHTTCIYTGFSWPGIYAARALAAALSVQDQPIPTLKLWPQEQLLRICSFTVEEKVEECISS